MEWLECGSPLSTRPASFIHGLWSKAGSASRTARRTNSARWSRRICVRIMVSASRTDGNRHRASVAAHSTLANGSAPGVANMKYVYRLPSLVDSEDDAVGLEDKLPEILF